MNDVFIKKDELNSWIAKYFKNDLISIDDMLCVIEDLDSDVENLQDKIQRLEMISED